jgi:hypothetical protein
MTGAIDAMACRHAERPTEQIITEIRDRVGVWRPLPTVVRRHRHRVGEGDLSGGVWLRTTLFLQPGNDTAHQTGVSTSVFKAGQTVPMKFQLKNAAGQIIQAGSAPQWLTPVKGSSMAAAVNESAYTTTTADTAGTYRWDSTGPQYIYNWNTSSTQAGNYWRVGVTLDDGQTYYVNIGLR